VAGPPSSSEADAAQALSWLGATVAGGDSGSGSGDSEESA
jgi:hypothetical protein